MAQASMDPKILKQIEDANMKRVLGQTAGLETLKGSDLFTKIATNTYQTSDGTQFSIDAQGYVCKGPAWLMGRTLQDAINHIIERKKGFTESNRDYEASIGLIR